MKAPVRSDGGSSSYYDIPLPEWLVQTILQRHMEGSPFIKTEELIEVVFGNDFDFGTLLKSAVRGYGAMHGGGKAGNDVPYEMNKVIYYSGKVKDKFARGIDESE